MQLDIKDWKNKGTFCKIPAYGNHCKYCNKHFEAGTRMDDEKFTQEHGMTRCEYNRQEKEKKEQAQKQLEDIFFKEHGMTQCEYTRIQKEQYYKNQMLAQEQEQLEYKNDYLKKIKADKDYQLKEVDEFITEFLQSMFNPNDDYAEIMQDRILVEINADRIITLLDGRKYKVGLILIKD